MRLNITLEGIERGLAQYSLSHAPVISPFPKEFIKGEPICASVLICFQYIEDGWEILFIKRSQNNLDDHSGQVAFPGGKCDRNDENLTAAALREAHEEIGLSPNHPTLLGELPEHLTITNYLVKPIICHITYPYDFNLDHKEVEKVFTIPLTFLANPANRQIETRNLNLPEHKIHVIYFIPCKGEVLWGASARITHTLLDALGLI